MTYTLRARVGLNDTLPCYSNDGVTCSGRGKCSESAPVCDCSPGYFGRACEIEPEKVPVIMKQPASLSRRPWNPWAPQQPRISSVRVEHVAGLGRRHQSDLGTTEMNP